MPQCHKCGRVAASAEMRRTPKLLEQGGQAWVCRESLRCRDRAKEARKR